MKYICSLGVVVITNGFLGVLEIIQHIGKLLLLYNIIKILVFIVSISLNDIAYRELIHLFLHFPAHFMHTQI